MPLIHIIILNDTEKDMVIVMIDTRIGKRIKQCRERLGLTQEQFAEKTGFTANYISTLERGASFPRCENPVSYTHLDVYKRQSLHGLPALRH